MHRPAALTATSGLLGLAFHAHPCSPQMNCQSAERSLLCLLHSYAERRLQGQDRNSSGRAAFWQARKTSRPGLMCGCNERGHPACPPAPLACTPCTSLAWGRWGWGQAPLEDLAWTALRGLPGVQAAAAGAPSCSWLVAITAGMGSAGSPPAVSAPTGGSVKLCAAPLISAWFAAASAAAAAAIASAAAAAAAWRHVASSAPSPPSARGSCPPPALSPGFPSILLGKLGSCRSMLHAVAVAAGSRCPVLYQPRLPGLLWSSVAMPRGGSLWP